MRRILLFALSVGLLGLGVYFQAEPTRAESDGIKVRLRLVDADTGNPIPGIVRVFQADDKKPLVLPGLYDRLKGLKPTATLAGWSVVPAAGGETTLPRAKLRVEALSGLDTTLA